MCFPVDDHHQSHSFITTIMPVSTRKLIWNSKSIWQFQIDHNMEGDDCNEMIFFFHSHSRGSKIMRKFVFEFNDTIIMEFFSWSRGTIYLKFQHKYKICGCIQLLQKIWTLNTGRQRHHITNESYFFSILANYLFFFQEKNEMELNRHRRLSDIRNCNSLFYCD